METREKIKFALKETNPWWKKGSFTVENYFPREIFRQIEQYFNTRQIIALVGLRRTGKTTLILKVVENYLRQLPAENIVYFSFDDFSNVDLEDVLMVYGEIFPSLNLQGSKYLFCFDEIQKLDNWQDKIKRLYDTYPNIKIFVSGSESLFIRKKIKETLGGRIYEFHVSLLNFREYLYFTGQEKFVNNMELYKREIIRSYRHFLKVNGFPELVNTNEDLIIHKYLKEAVVDKIIYKDIPQIFAVRNVEIVNDILELIIYSPGQIIDTVKLAKELKLSRQAVSSYLDYLEKSFLIKKVYNFSRNLRKQKRALKKYYPAIVFPAVVEDKFAFCFENSLVWQLDAQFFYRDAYQHEVDIIMVGKNKEIIPLEVKTGAIDLKGLNTFLRKYNLKDALVITIDREDKIGHTKILPFYKYLLADSRDE